MERQWEISKPYTRTQDGVTETCISISAGKFIAELAYDSDWDKANAILIFTAPDLLECAQALLKRLEDMTTADFALGYERAEREALQAAIARATEKVA